MRCDMNSKNIEEKFYSDYINLGQNLVAKIKSTHIYNPNYFESVVVSIKC